MSTDVTQPVTQTIYPYAYYSPSESYVESWQYQPVITIASPQANIQPMATKKETISTEQYPTISPITSLIPTVAPTQADTGTDLGKILIPIAIIGVAGLLVYGMVKK